MTLALALGALVAWRGLGLEFGQLWRGWNNGIQFLREELPPDWSILHPNDERQAWDALWETMEIAYLGTLAGFILSLPLALLAARNLMPPLVATPVRMVLSGIRVLPNLLWALLFVIVLGLGPLAGVLAITLYSVGYLGKLQYEAFEGLPRDVLDAARANGATRVQVARWIVIPEAGNALLSQALFMFEYNVRSSTILGLVGAGGIGFLINRYLSVGQFDRVFALLIAIFFVVIVIDALSHQIRKRFLDADPQRPGLIEVLTGIRKGPRS